MQFHEKLRQRVQQLGLNKAKAARDAGLPESTISNYLVKVDSLPRIDIAKKIAAALDVPLDWLADDEAEFPVPKRGVPTAANLSDDQLMAEVARRYRHQALRCLRLVEVFEKTNWAEIARALFARPLGTELLPELVIAVNLMRECQQYLIFSATMYDAKIQADLRHSEMPGADQPKEELDLQKILERAARVIHENDMACLVDDYRLALLDYANKHGKKAAEERYSSAQKKLKRLDASQKP